MCETSLPAIAVSSGKRGRDLGGNDRRVFDTQLASMRRHRRVEANRLSTSSLYGASVGCDTARQITDDEMGRTWMMPRDEMRRMIFDGVNA